MAPKRSTSKDTIERSIVEIVESVHITMLVLLYTQLFIKKYLDITWNKEKYAFITTNYKEDIKDRKI